MNIIEALKELKDGKCILSNYNNNIYSLSHNGRVLFYWHERSLSWVPACNTYNEISDWDFTICDNPTVKECREMKNTTLDILIRAITTLLRLKLHPLAVKYEDYAPQHYIWYSVDGSIEVECILVCKINVLSPCFKTYQDCKQVIEEIGHEDLCFMYKTLQGIE